MIKLIINKKGYALTYVLIIMMLLSILGLALVSSTITNFKIHKTTTGLNKSYYINDGAIEEALSELNEIAHRAEVDATSWISDQNSSFRLESKWTSFFSTINLQLETKKITEEEATRITEEAYGREFKKRYYTFFLENLEPLAVSTTDIFSTDYRLLNSDGSFIESDELVLRSGLSFKSSFAQYIENVSFEPESNPDFTAASLNDIVLVVDTSANRANIKIISTGAYNDYNKQITCDLDIVPPDYNYVVSTTSTKLEIYKNELLDNAIASYGDILINEGPVTINGNIYSYGTFPRLYKDHSQLGGILIGMNEHNLLSVVPSIGAMSISDVSSNGDGGELIVNGDLKSRSALKINGSNSKLKVSESVYANTFSVDRNSSNFEGSIDKNLYLLEDLMFLGNDSDLTVGTRTDVDNGIIWNILDLNPGGINDDNGTFRNISGSIIIDKTSINTNLTSNKYMIAGVAYLDMYQQLSTTRYSYYKTGLSFTTNRNNEFYASKIASTDKSTDFFDYTFASDRSISVPLVETIDSTGNIIDSTDYKSIHFLEKNREIEDGIETGLPRVDDADKNLYTINSINDNIGKKVKSNYALGVMMGNNKMYNPYKIGGNDPNDFDFVNINERDFKIAQKALFPMFDIKTNLLGTRNYEHLNNSGSRLEEYIDLNNNVISISNPDKFILINKDDRDIYLNIPPNQIASITAKDSNAIIIPTDSSFMNLTGIIVGKGNIFVNNSSASKFVFNGPIISDKSIVFYGSGEKEINNLNPENGYNDNLINLLVTSKNIYDLTYSNNGRSINILNNKKTCDSDIEVVVKKDKISNSKINISPSVNSNITFEGIIKTEDSDSIIINSWSER